MEEKVKALLAVAFLNMFDALLLIVDDNDKETLNLINEAVEHINDFVENNDKLDINKLRTILNEVFDRIGDIEEM